MENSSRKSLPDIVLENSGNMAVTLSIALLPIALAIGSGVDYTRYKMTVSAAQSAVDAAALAIARDAASHGDMLSKRATEQFHANLDGNLMPDVATVSADYADNITHVKALGSVDTSFLGIAGFQQLEFMVTAKAQVFGSTTGARCIHALDPVASDALIYNNKRGPLLFVGDSIIAPDCSVQVNSSSSGALFIKEDEGYAFAKHCIVGGVRGNMAEISPAPDPTCALPLPDPLASRPMPSKPACISGGITSSGSVTVLEPGNYCSGISVSDSDIRFEPGTYHISGGDLEVEADNSIRGNGVSFIMHPGSGAISMETDGLLSLTAMSSGPTSGFLVFDRNGSFDDHLFKTNKNDTSAMELNGYLYSPQDHMEIFWKRAGVGAGEKPLRFRDFGVTARTIDLHGYNQLFIDASDLDALIPELASSTGSGKLRLIE